MGVGREQPCLSLLSELPWQRKLGAVFLLLSRCLSTSSPPTSCNEGWHLLSAHWTMYINSFNLHRYFIRWFNVIPFLWMKKPGTVAQPTSHCPPDSYTQGTARRGAESLQVLEIQDRAEELGNASLKTIKQYSRFQASNFAEEWDPPSRDSCGWEGKVHIRFGGTLKHQLSISQVYKALG